ncbi:MAG: hypothetical protein ACLFQ8_01295 [Candidatus Aenigmatarchaeota archaeon]
MISNKGTSKSMEEILFLMIKLSLALVVIVLLAMNFSDMDIGCEQHNDNPAACIRDGNCRPNSTKEDDEWNVTCVDAVRTPNNEYNAVEDSDCFCPEGWKGVLDEESNYYGMCKKGNEYIACQYTLNPSVPEN